MTQMRSPIKLIVGLGNPGPQYEQTRHNAGFWFIENLAGHLGTPMALHRGYQGFVTRVTWQGESIYLLKPQTFMNRTGLSVAPMARFYKIAPEQILVAHDELDLEPGCAKIKFAGGSAGHNGLRDIQFHVGTLNYWRLRIGIGHPGHKSDVIGWVLGKPEPPQRIAIDQAIERAVQALDLLVAGDMEMAMNIIHTTAPPRPKPPRLQPH